MQPEEGAFAKMDVFVARYSQYSHGVILKCTILVKIHGL